jgi:hypothetical protein
MTEYTTEEKQQRFIEFLFTETEEGGAGGNPHVAKRLAGYHPTYSTGHLLGTKAVQEGIEKKMKEFFTQTAPESAMSLLSVLRDPTQIGSKDKIAAAKELLDRGGFVKTEKLEVSGGGGLFILPPKEAEDDDT